jgi:hypothetical protein
MANENDHDDIGTGLSNLGCALMFIAAVVCFTAYKIAELFGGKP